MRDELSHERSNLASAETLLAQARADAASSSSGLQSKVCMYICVYVYVCMYGIHVYICRV